MVGDNGLKVRYVLTDRAILPVSLLPRPANSVQSCLPCSEYHVPLTAGSTYTLLRSVTHDRQQPGQYTLLSSVTHDSQQSGQYTLLSSVTHDSQQSGQYTLLSSVTHDGQQPGQYTLLSSMAHNRQQTVHSRACSAACDLYSNRREHLGLLEVQGGADPDIDVRDPVCDSFYSDVWLHAANTNTDIYEQVLLCETRVKAMWSIRS